MRKRSEIGGRKPDRDERSSLATRTTTRRPSATKVEKERTTGDRWPKENNHRGVSEKQEQAPRKTRSVEHDETVDVGKLTVTWAPETFNPHPGSYTSMTVGPFSIEINVKDLDDVREKIALVHAELAECAEAVYNKKLASFKAKFGATGKVR